MNKSMCDELMEKLNTFESTVCYYFGPDTYSLPVEKILISVGEIKANLLILREVRWEKES